MRGDAAALDIVASIKWATEVNGRERDDVWT
jgi:hypothetical protein